MTALAKIATIARVRTFTFSGIEAVPVEVQVQISGGMPALLVVGLPDKAVGEARERMRAALSAIGLALPPRRILINLAPADLLKEGSHFDLPIALGVLAAMDVVPREDLYGYAAMGELSLDGTLNAVAGVLPAAIGASTLDLGLICPASQGGEAAWAGRIEVLAAADLLSLINHFRGTQVLTPPETAGVAEIGRGPDLSDVKGMETAKRAVEIAAAGGHNLLMIGSPGSGKSMLAARLPGLLPDLEPKEALEVSMIHSVAGLLEGGRLVMRPPFREPHHSASQAALTGGGQRAKPGEVSLAHRGVLFLDELPEFPKQTLESLRQPMESGRTTVARAVGTHHLSGTLPAGRGDESVPLRLPGRCVARVRAGAPLRRGLPEPHQWAGAGPDRPDGGGAARNGCGTGARAGRGKECGGCGSGGAGPGGTAGTLWRGWPDQQCRGRQPRGADGCRRRRRWPSRRWTSCGCPRAATPACCASHARSRTLPARRSCSARMSPRRWRSATACRDGRCSRYDSARNASLIRRTAPVASTTSRSNRTPLRPHAGCPASTISAAASRRACWRGESAAAASASVARAFTSTIASTPSFSARTSSSPASVRTRRPRTVQPSLASATQAASSALTPSAWALAPFRRRSDMAAS